MGPFFKTSALCFAAVCGLQSATATLTFTVEPVSDDVYTAANLARNGHLSVRIDDLVKDEDTVSSLTAALKSPSNGPTGGQCSEMGVPTIYANNKALFLKYTKNGSEPNYRQLFQQVLTSGVELIRESYPDSWSTVWADPAGANLSYLLWSKSNKIGCALAVCKDSSGVQNDAALVCQMFPAPQKDNQAFDQDYYKGLVERKTSLVDMKEEEINVSAGGGAIAIPSVLLASLVAIMATATA